MDQFTTIVVLKSKLEAYKKVLHQYEDMFEEMIVDPRVNNALKGYYQDKMKGAKQKIDDIESFENEVKEKGLYKTKLGRKLINKANNNPG